MYSIVNSSFLKEERVHERNREAIGPVSESGGWLREGDLAHLGIEIVYFGFDKSNNELVLCSTKKNLSINMSDAKYF